MNEKFKTTAALVVMAVLLVTGSTACNRQSSTDVLAKQLTIAIGEAPNTADPIAALDVGSAHLLNSMHAPLSIVGADGKPVMVLAESVTMAADGLSCEIKVKPAKFWDDKASPVTAEDVRYSFERVRASAHPHRWILDRIAGAEAFDKKQAEHLAGIEITGERALLVRFTKPEPDFPLLISSGLTSIIKAGSDKLPKLPFDQQLVGAGAWKPVRFDPGVSFELGPNPGFPQPSNAARLTFIVESNPQNQLEGMAKGRFDVIRLRGPMISESCQIDAGGVLQTKQSFKDTKLLQARANELTFLKWNWKSPQLADVPETQRQTFLAAVSGQIARSDLARTVYLGAAEPAYAAAPPSTLPASTEPMPSAPEFSFGSRAVSLLAANDPSSRQLAGYLQTQLRGLGFNVELTFVDLGNLVQRVLKDDYTICLLWVEQQIPSTGCFAWSLFWSPGSPMTVFGETLSTLGAVPESARGILNADQRRATYAKMIGDITQRQTAWTPLLSRSAVMMVNPRCEGLFLDVNGFPYFLFVRVKE